MIEILATGSGLTLQDGGRPAWGRFGVPPGGALDTSSMALANQLLGNRPDAPVLEIALRGTRLRVLQTTWLALAGAESCQSVAAPSARCFEAGENLEFTENGPGRYAYLAAPGGFAAPAWFGSVATDRRSGLGLQIESGVQLAAKLTEPTISTQGIACRWPSRKPEPLTLDCAQFTILRGPQYALFSAAAKRTLVEAEWSLSLRSDRSGYRLEGPNLPVPEMIPSEPVLPGSFQIPAGGTPIITMPDGPTVGGYGKIAVLRASDLAAFAQCPPKTKLQFSWAD